MISRRRLATGFAVAAAVLLAGRAAAVLFADHAWYSALGAAPLWSERVRDILGIHALSAAFAGLFALLNLSAVRRSIVSLAFPRRLGNVEFGEAVPRRLLDRAAFVLAAVVALTMSFFAPAWERVIMVRLGTRFAEIDPFFQADLGFYTAWIPLERAAYGWCLVLVLTVAVMVVGLYALTPSLRWQSGSFHVSVRVRRHLTVLAALFLLIVAWGYRLDGYELLARGSGPDGMFSYVDHQWLLPGYLALSVGTIVAAAVVALSGWMGQVRAGFFTIGAVLIFSVAFDLVLPSVVKRVAGVDVSAAHQSPYVATRAAYTARAYGLSRDGSQHPVEVRRFGVLIDSGRVREAVEWAGDSALVYPGAYGAALVTGVPRAAAPPIGTGIRRLAHAWAEQRLDLVWTRLDERTRIAARRDVRERVHALFPVFEHGSEVIPAYLGDSLVWVLETYSASETYPLSRRHTLAGQERSYFRHSGTAIVNAMTGRVTLVPAASPDPIAVAWRARFPANIRAGARDLLDALSMEPEVEPGMPVPVGIPATDAAFRTTVTRLYRKMQTALGAGDLKGFAGAYDSLGVIIRR